LLQVIEHDDEDLSSQSVSPLSSCLGLPACAADMAATCTENARASLTSRSGQSVISMELNAGGEMPPCSGHAVTSSTATSKGSQALLEAAVSSAICHPNVVQVRAFSGVCPFDYVQFQHCGPKEL
jgi:hypothetical protein